MANFDFLQIAEKIDQFINSAEGKTAIDTGAGIVEKQGDKNYIKAVLIAEALNSVTGAKPVIIQKTTGQYVITWEGSEQEKATEYFRRVMVDSITNTDTGEPVIVDFYPVVKPLGIKYGAPVVLGVVLVSAGIGYMVGRA